MRTPKEYTENLTKKIITTEMLDDCLYSVNKRAKNWRDKRRKYSNYRYDKYNYEERATAERDKMYQKKEILLSIAPALCVHKEFAGFRRNRVYSYQKSYESQWLKHFLRDEIVWRNSYFDYDNCCEVNFFDFEDRSTNPQWRYYLFYDFGTHSYHSPIPDNIDPNALGLPVITISTIETRGDDISDLVSMQFVDKVIALVESGDYKYVQTRELPDHLDDNPPAFKFTPDDAEIAWRIDDIDLDEKILFETDDIKQVYTLTDEEMQQCKNDVQKKTTAKINEIKNSSFPNPKTVNKMFSPGKLSPKYKRPKIVVCENDIQVIRDYCDIHGYKLSNLAKAILSNDPEQKAQYQKDWLWAKAMDSYTQKYARKWIKETVLAEMPKLLKIPGVNL